MRLLITGGAGFVALALAEAALEAGHSVVLLDLLDPPAPARRVFARFGERCLVERGDVLEGEAVADLIGRHRIDTVAHAAAVTAGPDRERRAPESIVSVNLLGTVAVIGAARGPRVRRFLHFATGSGYGAVPVEAGPIDEDATPLRPVSLYGITKAAAERTASRLDELDPFNLVIARLGPVFGPWEWATGMRDTLSPMFQATRLAVEGGEAVLAGEARTDWIYSRDVARGLLALIEAERPRRKVYNIGAGTRWPAAEWCARLAEVYSGFRWRIAAPGEAATVTTTPPRAALSTRRMAEEFGFEARFPGAAGFDDYRAWLETVGKEFLLG
jgi:nucleoside-diphosphate-sugar epimerase